jgi:hypothetical protein
MKKTKGLVIIYSVITFLTFQLPSTFQTASANFEIIEGGECGVLNASGPIKGTTTKVVCVDKDGKLIWSSNPEVYKPKIEATCDAECLADREGIARAEAEALDPKSNFPKWVTDAQNFFSNLVLSRALTAFGPGKYNYETPMPMLLKSDLENPSQSNFSNYKLTLRKWSDLELINLKRENHETGLIKQPESSTNKVNDLGASSSSTPIAKMEVLSNSDSKFLVMVYSNVAEKQLVVKASKKGKDPKTLYIQTDEGGFGSLLSSQKLSGHAFALSVDGKVKARATTKK